MECFLMTFSKCQTTDKHTSQYLCNKQKTRIFNAPKWAIPSLTAMHASKLGNILSVSSFSNASQPLLFCSFIFVKSLMKNWNILVLEPEKFCLRAETSSCSQWCQCSTTGWSPYSSYNSDELQYLFPSF